MWFPVSGTQLNTGWCNFMNFVFNAGKSCHPSIFTNFHIHWTLCWLQTDFVFLWFLRFPELRWICGCFVNSEAKDRRHRVSVFLINYFVSIQDVYLTATSLSGQQNNSIKVSLKLRSDFGVLYRKSFCCHDTQHLCCFVAMSKIHYKMYAVRL